MLPSIAEKRHDLAALCRRYGVARLDVFGSAARFSDFDEPDSDIDFLVVLEAPADDLTRLLGLQAALENLLHRRVDLQTRRAVETSRNYIRRRHILEGARAVYAA
jgi:predicted nucleotidyltransferase